MSPAKLQSLLQNAVNHHRAGRLAEAELVYRQVRAAAPKNFDVLHLSGLLAYQQGRVADAIELLTRAFALNPKAVQCEIRLAAALSAAKRSTDAERHLRHAVELKPDFHEAWDQLGSCLKQQDRLPEAIECHEKALALKPDFVAGWVNYGFTLRVAGKIAQALGCHERALAIDPSFAKARFGRAQALQLLHHVREAIAEYDAFLKLEPQAHEARSNRLFAMQNLEEISRAQLFAEHVAYGRALAVAPTREFTNEPEAERRLRVGILSPDFREHSCAYFMEPLLRHLDRERFEIYLYHDHFREDRVTVRLRPLAQVWRNVSGQPAGSLEAMLRDDQLDIMIDLAGHTGLTNRLPVLARKVAPVQVTYLGYPNTTGVPAIDYRFTDGIADPEGDADAFATEKLVRFALTAWTYLPPADSPDVAPLPAANRGYVTFGCFNDLAKIADSTLRIWQRVLAAVPHSRLRLKGRGLGGGDTRAELEARLTAAGIDLARVDLLERTADTRSHLSLYGEVDIALDTSPYNGTTTTCESLWMGVPVVSLAGDRHMSRVGASLLNAIGHPEWCANDADRYVSIAADLASDLARLAAIRAGLRTDLRASPLQDHAGQAQCFGAALRACWAAWCERTAPAKLAAT